MSRRERKWSVDCNVVRINLFLELEEISRYSAQTGLKLHTIMWYGVCDVCGVWCMSVCGVCVSV